MADPSPLPSAQHLDPSNENAIADEGNDSKQTQDPQTGESRTSSGEDGSERPQPTTHLSTQSFETPLRHHRRTPSTPRQVKETLHAHSEYTNSEDDGTAIHRINQYVIKQEIGRGSFGAVHRAVDQHGQEFAVKEFSKARLRKRAQSSILRRPHHRAPRGEGLNAPMHRRNASDIHDEEEGGNSLNLIREEIAIMKKLNHNNLVALFEVLDDPTEDSLYMVMEMCKKGVVMKVEVGDRADPYNPESCRCWFRDLILGIEYLHAQGIVHRDIKPDNLLLDKGDVLKVVDFGVSEMFEKDADMTTTKSAGSPAFLPPELCVTRHGPISGKAVDIWSMGVTLYCLYHGRVPFEEHSVLDLYEAIKHRVPTVEPQGDDPDFPDLILRILEKDPEKRIKMEELRVSVSMTASQLLTRKEHPWVTRRGLDPLLSSDENTSDLVEPPTEEEMNHAITGNLNHLVTVMKAVRNFRRVLDKKRPYVRDNILGQDASIVQPPLSMDNENAVQSPSEIDDDANEQLAGPAYAGEGVQRRAKPEPMNLDTQAGSDSSKMQIPQFQSNIVQPTPQRPNFSPRTPRTVERPAENTQAEEPATGSFHDGDMVQSPPGEISSPRSASEHFGKGQAHDPLADFRFLNIGSGDDYDAQPPGSPPAVCESPPAAELDIYEQAYHEEVQRIRSRTMHGSLYLTRRVEDAAGVPRGDLGEDEMSPKSAGLASHWGDVMRGIAGREPRRQQTAPAMPAAKVAAQAVMNRARDKGLQATQQAAAKMGVAAESMQVKMRHLQEEAERMREEGSEGTGAKKEAGDTGGNAKNTSGGK